MYTLGQLTAECRVYIGWPVVVHGRSGSIVIPLAVTRQSFSPERRGGEIKSNKTKWNRAVWALPDGCYIVASQPAS